MCSRVLFTNNQYGNFVYDADDFICEILGLLIKHDRKEGMKMLLNHDYWTTNRSRYYFSNNNTCRNIVMCNPTERILRKEMLTIGISDMMKEIELIDKLE